MVNETDILIHKKVWGEEHWIVNKEYCGKKLVVNRGFRSSIHYHKDKDETFYMLSGKLLMELDGTQRILKAGDKLYVPTEAKHRFTGLENSEMIEFSTHHREDDSFRDSESGRVPEELFQRLIEAYGAA